MKLAIESRLARWENRAEEYLEEAIELRKDADRAEASGHTNKAAELRAGADENDAAYEKLQGKIKDAKAFLLTSANKNA